MKARADRGDLSEELRSLLMQGADMLNPDHRDFEPAAVEAALVVLEKGLPQLQAVGNAVGGRSDTEEQADGTSGE